MVEIVIINDGIPHMTYQRPGRDVNFVWVGDEDQPVMVCPGGYAEKPVFFFYIDKQVIDKNVAFFSATVPVGVAILNEFKDACENWLDDYDYEHQ